MKMLKPRLRAADTRRVKPGPKIADPFYGRSEWRQLRDQVRREARGICEWPGCRCAGKYVDHKVERGLDGGAELDRSNLWLLCPSHHAEKTVAARAARSRRTDW